MADRDTVRLLISDVGGADGSTFLFTDDEIDTFLTLRSDVRLAAALALRTIAANEVQTLKAIQFFDLRTDGPSTAKSLAALADSLESQADADADFDIAEMGVDAFARLQLRSSWEL